MRRPTSRPDWTPGNDVDFTADATHAQWAILVDAYDGQSVTIRANGRRVASGSVDLNPSANRDIQLGRWVRTEGDPDWYFNGRMAETRIFDQALDDDEIQAVEEYLDAKCGVT